MIHTIYTMTVGRYGKLEKTQDARLLRRWYNVMPVGLFRNRVERFFDQVRDIFDSDDMNNSLLIEADKLYMMNKLLQLSVLYSALKLTTAMQSEVYIMLSKYGIEPDMKSNHKKYVQAVKQLTGIDIDGIESLERLQKEITRMTDKFRERFPEKEKQDSKPGFSKFCLSVFSIMEMPYDYNMTLADFSDLKTLASERAKQYERLKEKHGAT